MSAIRHSLGEKKKGIEMEFEPSNCIFYLLFSVLLTQKEEEKEKKTPKSNKHTLCLTLLSVLPSQINENEIPLSPSVPSQLFCLLGCEYINI